MNVSKRIEQLPPYPFAELDRKKAELKAKGVDIIDISIGDPDLPTPEPIVSAMQEAVKKPANHTYPSYSGCLAFKEAVVRWYKKRFDVLLDPATEVCALIGSKEGIANIHYAFVDPGDIVIVPNPGYPVYSVTAKFAGGLPYMMPLHPSNRFLPDLNLIPENILQKAKIIHLNYPNNPTGAVATEDLFKSVVALAKRHSTIVCHDAAYTEIYYDEERPRSFLQTKGAKEVGIEFHSLSKTFNMTGWRIGFAVGNAKIIEGLAKIKTNIDSGQFTAIQETAVFALDNESILTAPIRRTYQERRDVFVEALKKIGMKIEPPKAAFYLWMNVPSAYNSSGYAAKLLEQGVVATPGTAFGEEGEGFIRFALTRPKERLEEAALRIHKLG